MITLDGLFYALKCVGCIAGIALCISLIINIIGGIRLEHYKRANQIKQLETFNWDEIIDKIVESQEKNNKEDEK